MVAGAPSNAIDPTDMRAMLAVVNMLGPLKADQLNESDRPVASVLLTLGWLEEQRHGVDVLYDITATGRSALEQLTE